MSRPTGKPCLIVVEGSQFDYAGAFQSAFDRLAIDAEVVRVPSFRIEEFNVERLRSLQGIIKEKAADRYVIYCPGLAEFYMPGPDVTLAFSAYRRWHKQRRIRVIPHIWTTANPVGSIDRLRWAGKPQLRIGFMGTAYASSRVANLALKLPFPLRRWLLSGGYLRSLPLLARMYEKGISVRNINTFPRLETLNVLRREAAQHEGDLEIVDTGGFTGSEADKARYAAHLERMSYIICPRGSENFSFRVYETLKFGRVPVIVDTDMVLPPEIDWSRLAVVVPYKSLSRIYEIIRHDYDTKSQDDFNERQELAFSTMQRLQSMHWLEDVLKETSSA